MWRRAARKTQQHFRRYFGGGADTTVLLHSRHGDGGGGDAGDLMPSADVLIIGAGPAGINAAYALEASRHRIPHHRAHA